VLIVPAAGLGTRLRTTLPKVLARVNGRPMLDWLLDLYRGVVDRAIIVVHPSSADQIRAYGETTGARLEYQVQETPTGMLDAILRATQAVASSDASRILITWCDQVAVTPQTVERLTTLSDAQPAAALVMPTARRTDPYIHLERDSSDRIVRVLHRREGDRLPLVGESDMGLFSLSRDAFLDDLTSFSASAATGEATGERNFLPFIPWIAARGEIVTFPCVDPIEALGVNTPEELQRVESYLAARHRGD
jgi:bifunctional UDP-N-acetylglucosamine pyrophosphorylase / glucosamine-1-phosphate N-acetyltransferase